MCSPADGNFNDKSIFTQKQPLSGTLTRFIQQGFVEFTNKDDASKAVTGTFHFVSHFSCRAPASISTELTDQILSRNEYALTTNPIVFENSISNRAKLQGSCFFYSGLARLTLQPPYCFF